MAIAINETRDKIHILPDMGSNLAAYVIPLR